MACVLSVVSTRGFLPLYHIAPGLSSALEAAAAICGGSNTKLQPNYDAKMRASSELDNLMDAGYNFRNSPDGRDRHVHNDADGGFDYYDVIFKVGDDYFRGVINIKKTVEESS
jgi:hypothetical protein